METYIITTLNPAPSMTETRVTVQASSYQQAVVMAQELWRETRRATRLRGRDGIYWWHYINPQGIAVDRNHGSGVPKSAVID